jgi:EAL and modified HD-GYP domain-containing signal transduction protein
MLETTLLARQPIYDEKLNIQAFELLFRSSDPDAARVEDGNAASSTVLLNAFTSLPVDDVLEGKPAFINFTRELLDHALPIDPSRLVIEVLEDIEINAATIAAIAKLKAQGYRIALDDYVYADHHTELLPLADIIKIDVLNERWSTVTALARRLLPMGAKLLAEKVETREMFDACREIGFTLFQGYFLAKPQVVKGRKLSGNQHTALQLLAALRKPDISLREVETLIQTDAMLSLKVLRMVNSAMFNLNREVDSIQRATAMLGLDRIRSLAQMLVMAGLENKPKSLLASTLLRARLGQVMAEQAIVHGVNSEALDADAQFTAGLLSTLDAYLDMDLSEILKEVPLSAALKDAILHRQGNSGLLLDVAVAFDQAALEHIDWNQLSSLGIASSTARDLYIDSLRWVADVLRNVK